MKFVPPLEENFDPLALHLTEEKNRFAILYGINGKADVVRFGINDKYLERIIKFLLWQRGPVKIEVSNVSDECCKAYSENGARYFDYNFFSDSYKKELIVGKADILPFVTEKISIPVRASFEGSRIGIDLGASSIKIWAGINGEERLNTSLPWRPKDKKDIGYHISAIKKAIEMAEDTLPRIDAIGISTAGIVNNNCILISSLFNNTENYNINAVYNTALSFKPKRITICNDGDAAAAAAYVLCNKSNVLGLSMGSSLAGGYINSDGCFADYISELAFCPVDVSENAPCDPWSGDIGTGVDYFSAQAVARYAKKAGIEFEEGLPDSKITALVYKLFCAGDKRAEDIYKTIGIILGYTVPLYYYFYKMDTVMLLGGVAKGKAGQFIAENASKVLREEFCNINSSLLIPDEIIRLTGQAKIAAALP